MRIPTLRYALASACCFFVLLFWLAGSTALQAHPVQEQTVSAEDDGAGAPPNATQFVATTGNDSNSGINWGSAVGDIPTAYSKLPACAYNNYTWFSGTKVTFNNYSWPHCGTIIVGPGQFTVSSEIRITSPFVTIKGQDPSSTVLNWTGTSGAAIYWTSIPFIAEFAGSGGLYNLSIDAYNGGSSPAATYGLETFNLNNFHMRNVTIHNFSGAGSSGWLQTCDRHGWNEKYDVEATLQNNAVGFEVGGSGGTIACTTGYGRFNLKIEAMYGQTAFLAASGANFSNNALFLMVNLPQTNSNGVVTQTGSDGAAALTGNLYDVHIEAPKGTGVPNGYEVNNCSSCTIAGNGQWNQDSTTENFNFFAGQVLSVTQTLRNDHWLYWLNSSGSEDPLLQLGSNNTVYIEGDATGKVIVLQPNPGKNGFVFNATGLQPQIIPADGGTPACFDAQGYLSTNLTPGCNGVLLGNGSANKGISATTLTLSHGKATFNFGSAYPAAPVCALGPSTTGYTYKVTTSTSSVEVTSSSDSDNSILGVICALSVN